MNDEKKQQQKKKIKKIKRKNTTQSLFACWRFEIDKKARATSKNIEGTGFTNLWSKKPD
jgi:hypothetical protein